MPISLQHDKTPTTLPTGQELADAYQALAAVCESLIHLQWRVCRIARAADAVEDPELALVEGDDVPTFAHIGELYVFTLDARARLDEAANYIATLETALEDLDIVRRLHEDVRA